jgi:hypothetical protein
MKAINPLDHPICFAKPLKLDNVSTWTQHVPFGMFIVDVLRPKILVELGTHTGVSYSAFCQALKQLGLDAHCYAIDTWDRDSQADAYSRDILAELHAYHDPLYGGFSRLVQSTFDGAVNYFSDGSIDLLHINGLDTYQAVKNDFETWFPKLSRHAVVLFHNTNVREEVAGVWKFWTELQNKYPHFEFFHGQGLGLLRVGNESVPALEPLFSLSDDESKQIKEFFFTLGFRLSAEHVVQTLSTSVAEKEQSIHALSVNMDELAEIKRSKAWKFALFIRQIRVLLFPPNSYLDQALGQFMNVIFPSGEQIEQNQNLHENLTLSRMYDYCKTTNRIVFEDSPERIYLQRPRVIGNFLGNLDEGEAVCPPAYVSVIEDALVFGGSNLVIADKKNILSDELMDFPGKEIGIKSPLVKSRRKNRIILEYKKESNLDIKEGILLSCEHDNNYFHWLVECLPKLILIDELKEFEKAPILIPKGLHQNLIAALEKVNINSRQLIYLEPNIGYQVECLIYPSALSRVIDRYQGRPVFDTDIVLSHKWISKVGELLKCNMQSKQKPWRKLFLTRKKGLRALGNREELELMLLEQGFEIVELDNVSLDFQIELFSQAAIIVAPTGAALTNMLFCQPGTRVIIFKSNHEVTNYYFWSNLGAVTKLDITIIAGQRLFKLTNYWSVHDDYIVDANLVLDEIKKHEQ